MEVAWAHEVTGYPPPPPGHSGNVGTACHSDVAKVTPPRACKYRVLTHSPPPPNKRIITERACISHDRSWIFSLIFVNQMSTTDMESAPCSYSTLVLSCPRQSNHMAGKASSGSTSFASTSLSRPAMVLVLHPWVASITWIQDLIARMDPRPHRCESLALPS